MIIVFPLSKEPNLNIDNILLASDNTPLQRMQNI